MSQKRKTNNNLEMKICRCGRIHFYQEDLLTGLLEQEKELVLICSNCGHVMHIGADKEPKSFYLEDAKEGEVIFNMYAYCQESETIDADNFEKEKMNALGKRTIGKIIISEGIGVMMETGFYQ